MTTIQSLANDASDKIMGIIEDAEKEGLDSDVLVHEVSHKLIARNRHQESKEQDTVWKQAQASRKRS